ncbi:MAG: hypothetical protein HY319_19475 [Armatimonadetes bacterium]|nr:hypothetical protein [Armatimonadota bacterium]
MKTIRFLMPYMGRWPEWFELYLETCRWNPTVEWLFFTDCPVPDDPPPNVIFHPTDLQALSERFSARLGFDVRIKHPYKLCDFRPLFGLLFSDYLTETDYWGHGDIDVFYGNLRGYLSEEMLRCNIISMHRKHLSGHLALYRNSPEVNELYRNIEDWKEVILSDRNFRMDEEKLPASLKFGHFRDHLLTRQWSGPPVGLEHGFYFHESWNTPRDHLNNPLSLRRWRWGTPLENRLWNGQARIPDVWFWKEGRLTNNVDPEERPYLHAKTWAREDWRVLKKLLRADAATLRAGFQVSRYGISPLEASQPLLPLTQRAQFQLRYLRLRAATRMQAVTRKWKRRELSASP